MFRSVLLVSRLQVDVVIYSSPLNKLRPDSVDLGVRVQANRAVRLYPLVRNDLVRTNSEIPVRRGCCRRNLRNIQVAMPRDSGWRKLPNEQRTSWLKLAT